MDTRTVPEATLEDLRREIDDLDLALLDLLNKRMAVSKRVGHAKGNGTPTVRPGRETVVLRRLLAANHGNLPASSLVRIWREIFSASSAVQSRLTVCVLGLDGEDILHRIARNHFGVMATIVERGSCQRVLTALADQEAEIGLLPVPESDAIDMWWRHLYRTGPRRLFIVARIPVHEAAAPNVRGGPEALAGAAGEPEETGNDRSLLVAESDGELSRAAWRDLLTGVDLSVRETAVVVEPDGVWLHFAEVEGFIADGDARLEQLVDASAGRIGAVKAIGAYAVALDAQTR